MRKAPLMIALLGIIFGAFPVFADTIVSQTNETSAGTSNGISQSIFTQFLGNNLSGSATGLTIKFSITGGTVGRVYNIIFSECPDNNYSGCTTTNTGDFLTLASANVATSTYPILFNTAIDLNPSKFYAFSLNEQTGSRTDDVSVAGGPTNSFVQQGGGSFTTCLEAGSASMGTIGDCYFILSGTGSANSVYSNSYTTVIAPISGSTTASTFVQLKFSYHAASQNNIIGYIINLQDNTMGTSTELTGSASTGDTTVTRYATLASGHTYKMTAYVYNAAGQYFTGFGSTFSVVTSGYTVGGTFPSTFLGGSTTVTQIPLPNIISINDNNATSSLDQASGGWTNIPSYFAQRVPWGYLFDIAKLYDSAATSSTEFGAITLDLKSLNISSTTKSFLPDEFTLLSTTTATQYLGTPFLVIFNSLVIAVGWIGLMGYWYKRGIAI